MALAAYGVQDDDWDDIKRVLASRPLDRFYMDVNGHLSLILMSATPRIYQRRTLFAWGCRMQCRGTPHLRTINRHVPQDSQAHFNIRPGHHSDPLFLPVQADFR